MYSTVDATIMSKYNEEATSGSAQFNQSSIPTEATSGSPQFTVKPLNWATFYLANFAYGLK